MFAYLCADLYSANDSGERQFGLVIRIAGHSCRLGAAEECVSSVDLSTQIIYFCASQALHAKMRLSRRL